MDLFRTKHISNGHYWLNVCFESHGDDDRGVAIGGRDLKVQGRASFFRAANLGAIITTTTTATPSNWTESAGRPGPTATVQVRSTPQTNGASMDDRQRPHNSKLWRLRYLWP
jgi:hypothetical protein